MTPPGDSHEDMERFALDQDTADRLLSGALDPEDAPHRYGEVAALLRIAAGPTSGALDGEVAAVPVLVEAIRSGPATRPARRRTGARTRMKAAAALVVAALTLTGSLAAADALPGPAQRVAADALAVVGVHVPEDSGGSQTPPHPATVPPESTRTSTSSEPTGVVGPATTSAPPVAVTTVAPSSSSTTATAPSHLGASAGLTNSPPPSTPADAPQSAPSPSGGGGRPSAAPPPRSPSSGEKLVNRPTAGPQRGSNGSSNGNADSNSDGSSKGAGAQRWQTRPGH